MEAKIEVAVVIQMPFGTYRQYVYCVTTEKYSLIDLGF